jgi:hypothetical protein
MEYTFNGRQLRQVGTHYELDVEGDQRVVITANASLQFERRYGLPISRAGGLSVRAHRNSRAEIAGSVDSITEITLTE